VRIIERMTVSGRVAEEIRVEMARRQLTGVELGARTGKGQRWASRRMRADVPITLDDLYVIAGALGVDPRKWLPGELTQTYVTRRGALYAVPA
jgi:transcriptional regulator with XRE-family HTH domain